MTWVRRFNSCLMRSSMFVLLRCLWMDALKKKFGPRWTYLCAPAILAIPLPVRFKDEVIDASTIRPRSHESFAGIYPQPAIGNIGRRRLNPGSSPRGYAPAHKTPRIFQIPLLLCRTPAPSQNGV